MPPNGALFEQVIRRIESGHLKLPVYSPVALKMQELAAGRREDIGAIEALISSDQALASEVLRAANSPFYCGISPVRSIRGAIVRMGMQQMRRLVVLATERSKYRARHREINRMLEELWNHASMTALSAQWLSKRLHFTGIEEICFVSGLLHDIGKLVLLRAVDEIQSSENLAPELSAGCLDEMLAAAHCQVGCSLLKRWNIPEIYCQAARDHHHPEFPPGDLTMAILRLANEGSRVLQLEADPNPAVALAARPEAALLKAGEIYFRELQGMLENHLAMAA